MTLARVGLAGLALCVGCVGATTQTTAGGSACEWLEADTIERTLGVAIAAPPAEITTDVWSCVWRGADAELSVRFDRFDPSVRSVQASLIALRAEGSGDLVTVEARQGAFTDPGVWYGETPLDQYGMVTIRLAHLDRTEPDLDEFRPVVAAVIGDVIASPPAVPG